MSTSTSFLFGTALALLLVACGGGGGSGSTVLPTLADGSSTSSSGGSASSAEGLWKGTASYLGNRTVKAFVLGDGTYYMVYSAVGSTNIGGVIQGSGTALNGSFSSTNARDYNLEGQGVRNGTLSASYTPQSSFAGSATFAVGTPFSFTTTYDINYGNAPSLSAIQGTYPGVLMSSAGPVPTVINVSSNGTVTGLGLNVCSVSGNVRTRSSGNAYDLSLNFGSLCGLGSQTFTGHAYLDADTGQVFFIALRPDRSEGVFFTGQ